MGLLDAAGAALGAIGDGTKASAKEGAERLKRVLVGVERRNLRKGPKTETIGGVPLPNVEGFEGKNRKWHSKTVQAGLSTQIVVQATDVTGAQHTIGAIQTMTPTENRPLQRLSEIGNDTVVQTIPNGVFSVDIAVSRLVFDYQRLPAAFARGFRHIHAQRLPFDIVVLDYNQYQEFMIPPVAQYLLDTGSALFGPVKDLAGHLEPNDQDAVDVDGRGFNNTILEIDPTKEKGDPDRFKSKPGKEGNVSTGLGLAAFEFVTTRYVNCWLTNYSYTYDQSNYLIAENATIWAEMVQDEKSPVVRNDMTGDVVEQSYNDNIASMRNTSISGYKIVGR